MSLQTRSISGPSDALAVFNGNTSTVDLGEVGVSCDGLRAKVLSECVQAGASVAGIALAHGLNANLVHKWRRQARELQARGAFGRSGRHQSGQAQAGLDVAAFYTGEAK